ncbi:hypothetical protein ACS0TY_017529 [Phlomoides rotata]
MSVVQFPGAIDSSVDLQVWDNAAFDNGGISEDLTGSRQSWGSLKSVFGNPKASFDSVSDKENQGLVMENQVSSSLKSSSTPFKQVNIYESGDKSRIKSVFEKGIVKNEVSEMKKKKEIGDVKRIDEEIEEIESEIVRLKSRLQALKLEKCEKVVEKRGRVVPAKFMEQKQGVKIAEDLKIIDGVSNTNVKSQVNRRGISLGPAEILSVGRRGMSMGPSEILGSGRKSSKHDTVTPLQSRRKSCFWKLQGIDEEREKGKSSSVSPRSRKLASKAQIATRQAVTTIGSRKSLKKEETVINSIQPKKLFKEGEKSVAGTNKKPLRPGRVVASRYNQSTNQASAMRKRSLPESDTDNGKRVDKKRSLSPEKLRVIGTESRVKKRWDIPSEIVVRVEGERSPQSIVAVPDLLPRLRIARGMRDSPRDSGPAKKVVELIGRKSFFSNDEDVEPASLCQALTYPDEDDEES